jgi:general L-amino acid transport system permease protein
MTSTPAPRRRIRRLWRTRRSRRIIIQALLGGVALLLLVYFFVRASALDLSPTFLRSPAGFGLANEWAFGHSSTESRIDAYVIGVWNTVRLITISIAFATILGVVAGVARLSKNWIVNRLGLVYVETVRNTPLLVQIIFWWIAVFLTMPAVSARRTLFDLVWFSNRGLAIPWPRATGDFAPLWAASLLVALALALWVRHRRVAREDATGEVTRANRWAFLVFIVVAALTFVATGLPYRIAVPEIVLSGVNIQRFSGGLLITPQFAAVFIALTTYTGAFIAEIVRGSIQALPPGQTEAAQALGFSPYQRMTLIILPQALRIMIPALTNQYLNLTKNSSLAIVVGYSELFFVGIIIVNNAGHAVPMFALIILTYQAMSLLISVGMNYLNRRVRLASV